MMRGMTIGESVADRALRSASCHPMQRAGAGVMFIDGHSGAGKTTLARELQAAIATRTGDLPQIVSMDELYPGWDGLAAGSASVAEAITRGSYERYDWHAEAFTETIVIAADRFLIVEGCGSISPAALAAASAKGRAYALWLALPEQTRKERALARDGEMFAPHWDEWAAQEEALFARTEPLASAHEIVHPT